MKQIQPLTSSSSAVSTITEIIKWKTQMSTTFWECSWAKKSTSTAASSLSAFLGLTTNGLVKSTVKMIVHYPKENNITMILFYFG